MNRYKYQVAKFEFLNYRFFWENASMETRTKVLDVYGEGFDLSIERNKRYIKGVIKQCVQDNLSVLPHQIFKLKNAEVLDALLPEIKRIFNSKLGEQIKN